MAYEALRHCSLETLRQLRFVSNVDGTDLIEAIRDLRPEETLFILCSKSFKNSTPSPTRARHAMESSEASG